MAQACPTGQILRKAASVKGYKRADGTRVASTKRGSSCMKDLGAPGHGKKRIVLPKKDEGLLKKHGYSTSLPVTKRHAAIREAMRSEGSVKVIRYLNGIANLSSVSHPSVGKILRADQRYASEVYAK